ncbi:MAG TPA: aminotransferase class V-fold PLP-dependent enzyme, partial [Sphingomonadales bacterium]|nr:aminotransferase class V-fold PLP-dependent enzyme [Sphingomonadales bacterium]
MTRLIYLDYNATSPLKPKVREAVERYLGEGGNPSSVHAAGRRARAAVDAAREEVAAFVGVKPAAVVFTSGGTEANNQALRAPKAASIVISAIEHDSVIGAAYAAGVPVFEVPVDGSGVLRLDALCAALEKAPGPALVSIMLVNNETGVIQPTREAFDLARGFGSVT